MSKPKTTLVGEVGLGDVLDELTANEPEPTGAAPTQAPAVAPVDVQVLASETLPATGPGDQVNLSPSDLAPPGPTPREAAENAVELVLTFVGRSCDNEWQPDDDGERDELVTALERVLERRPMLAAACGKIPPELILAAVVHRYARRRVTRPSTAARLRAWAAGSMPRWLRRALGVQIEQGGRAIDGPGVQSSPEPVPPPAPFHDPYDGRA